MPANKRRLVGLGLITLAGFLVFATPAAAQTITALPDQTSRIRLSNHDINHVVCQGSDIEDVKFSAEKQIAVEKGGADAWIKFLVKESDDNGAVTRTFVTAPSEFFVSCNGAVYPLYAEPADIPAQTVVLAPGGAQRAKANVDLLGPLADEERAISITMAMLQDRVPASFSVQAPTAGPLHIASLPGLTLQETRRIAIDGAGLSASAYRVQADRPAALDERSFLVSALGANIFAVTLDATTLQAGEAARLIIVRRGAEQ
jgi:conjugal transfer pilus assembly protein TraK